MRIVQAATAAFFLLLILAWIPLRTLDTDTASFGRTLATLDRFAAVETALNLDALSARVGTLRNYDPLGREEDSLNDLVGRLKETAPAAPDQAATIDRLAQLVDQQTMLAEQFKSNNALLQNSLAYFQLFTGRLGVSDDPAMASAVRALSSAMLQLTLDTSPAAAKLVADRLEQLETLPAPPGQADSRAGLLAYGRMLHDLLPRTDDLVKALQAVPAKTEQEKLRATVLSQQAASQMWAGRLRLLLYATSIILFACLVHLARRLRARARALRERAAFEHVIARVSIGFLNAPPRQIDAQIERALAEFSAMFGADRAYFLQVGNGAQNHVWCREGAAFPAGWPDAAPELSVAADAAGMGFIHVPRPNRLPRGPVRDGLAAAGLQGWISMASTDSGGIRRILGFDALRPCRITDPADVGFARMALDVLANAVGRQVLEQEKARLATRLQQARRMETVGALASGIAHNFNNLIGAMLGYAEMAEAGVTADSRIARNLSEIRSAGNRARDLVEQILDFGRPRHRQHATIDVVALVAEAASLLRVSLPRQIELVVLDTAEPALVWGEIAQLQQVILNLCNNAAQAMAEDGRIEIATTVTDVADTLSLDNSELPAGRYVSIAVSDTGRGMTEEIVRRIFEPFYTTRPAGNGLGLATVKEIVIEHSGAIQVRSTPGVGSRFEVWLPGTSEAALPMAEIAPTRAPDRMETVLLLDDDRERLQRDEEILAAIGYEPVGFTQLADAVAACRNLPDRFDALVVGQSAPVATVLEVAAALHHEVPDLPILLATATASEIDLPALTASGVREVVSRPLDPAEIASALGRCIASADTKVQPG